MQQPYPPVDLTSCDLEPIHIIGHIQSFGWLVSFSSDWIVNHISTNCAGLFGVEPLSMIGMPAAEYFSEDALHEIRSRLQMLGSPDTVERIFDIDLIGDGRRFDVAVHASGRSFVLEAEPAEQGRRRDYVGYVRPMVDRLRKSGSIEKVLDAAARQLRGLTGFDRVMVYRFEPGGAGEVVAESINGQVDSFRGLHFPASDIPAQARRLYARNILRIISDVDDPTVPIVPAAGPGGNPLDLSMSGLRAVSPIHIEYLRNMGVKASMSVSIMRRGELWGLMACHHHAPLHLNYSVRTAAELFGEFLAFLLEQVDTESALVRRDTSMKLHDEIMAQVAGGTTLFDAFDEFAESIAKVIPYDGVAGWIGGELIARGQTPDAERMAALARFLNTAGASRVWASDNLPAQFPPAKDYADCCAGILALPVSRAPRDYIVLFRKEHVHTVSWAGDPSKPMDHGPLGPRLTPRKSFELWKEERRGFSRPWLADEVATAESLRVTLLEVVLRIADAAGREREAAGKRQDILIAELNHRVRNILNLIRSLVTQSRAGSDSIEQFAEIVGDRIYSLARAHDQVTRMNWSAASLHDLILTESKAYIGDKADRVSVTGTDVLIAPGAFSTLALVVHELMTNSCKYGALSDRHGKVSIALARDPEGGLLLEWRESDGPPVSPPTRRGFGSSIIERTIPHELGGMAEVDYAPSGLVARMTVPDEHIAAYQNLPEAGAQPQPAAEPATDIAALEGEALIVEDNMIIAMEAEDILLSLGASRCHVAASVRDAQAVMATNRIAFALLDINLGGETSEEIAATLDDEGVPFVFASGYGEHPALQERFADAPIVTKPYTAREVRAAAVLAIGTWNEGSDRVLPPSP